MNNSMKHVYTSFPKSAGFSRGGMMMMEEAAAAAERNNKAEYLILCRSKLKINKI